MCGENRFNSAQDRRHPGSPPHVRGKPKTLRRYFNAIRDHPRMCGENLSQFVHT